MNKEQIYDERISPLMSQIIDICKEHKIAMVMSFHLPDAEQDTLHCTTALVSNDYQPSDTLLEAWSVVQPNKPVRQITVRNAQGETTLVSVLG